MQTLRAQDLAQFQQAHHPTLLDVRTEMEFAQGSLEGAINIPVDQLLNRLDELSKEQPLVVFCRSGGRSQMAGMLLASRGFTKIIDLEGGLLSFKQ